MRCPKVLIFFSFLFISLSSKGEERITWLQQESLQKNGWFYNYGFVTEPKTFGIVFNNQSKVEKTYYIKLNNPHINRIYVKNKENDTLYITGDRFLFNSRPVYFWEFVFPIHVKPNYTDSLQFQIHKNGENLAFQVMLFQPKTFDKIHDGHLYFYSIFTTVTLFLFLLFVFLGFYKKDAKHFIFAAFIFTSAGWALNERGIFFQYLWPNNIGLQNRLDTFFATPSLGLLLFILYLNSIYKELIGKKVRILMVVFLSFLLLRTVVVFIYPGLMNNSFLKLNILRLSNGIMIILVVFIITTLIPFIKKRILFLDTFGFIVYFLYILKLLLKQINLDFIFTERFYNFAYPIMQTVTIGIFTISNYIKYREERKRKTEIENQIAINKEKEISEKIIAVQENERESIGKNIHDQVGGLLAAAKIKLQTLKFKQNDEELQKNLDQIISIIDKSSDEMYNVVDDLVPPMMDGKDLNSIIQSRIEIFEKNNDIQFNTNIPSIYIEPKLMLKFYRIISELVSNSIKHAQCNKINIQFLQTENGYTIDYTDNGLGFNQPISRNHGLNNIESRVKFLHGNIDFFSAPGKTHYSIHFPFQTHEK